MQRADSKIDYRGSLPLHARNATLPDLADVLKAQHGRKVDVVAPASKIRSEQGVWVVEGADAVIDADGVTPADGRYRPTDVADDGLSDKLGIPRGYLRRMRDERVDLYDANVNGWLHGSNPYIVGPEGDPRNRPATPPDPRSFLLRGFKSDNGEGIARAFLSDRYRIVDNLDVLMAALSGVRDAGVDVEVDGCDLTDRRMMVRVSCPQIRAYAPDLLAGYRSPFDGRYVAGAWTPERVADARAREGRDYAPGEAEPVVFAGFVISNSETGGGAFSITPRLTVEVCRNGLTVTADALREVHLGGRMDEGVVRWSEETQRKSLDLVTAKARDAVATFLDVDYVRGKVAEISAQASAPVDKPEDTVRHVAKTLQFGEQAADAILGHFIAGGQITAGGVMQAVTSWAQTLDDAEQAADAEAGALDALALAAR